MEYRSIDRGNGIFCLVRSSFNSACQPDLTTHEQIINELSKKIEKLEKENKRLEKIIDGLI